MCAFALFIQRDGPLNDETVVRRMLSGLADRATQVSGIRLAGNAGAAWVRPGAASGAKEQRLPPIDPDTGAMALCDARLDNRDELLPILSPLLTTSSAGDGDLILAAYKRWGTNCARYLHGDFAFAIWDPRDETVFAARDLVGLKSLYYAVDGSSAAVASTLPAVMAACPRPPCLNREYLSGFLRCDDRLATTETAFSGIQRLRAGHQLLISSARMSVETFAQWSPAPVDASKSEAAVFEEFGELFARSVRARLRTEGSAAIFVSGGLDSSAIVSQAEDLARQGIVQSSVVGFSAAFTKSKQADETSYVRALAEHCRAIPIRSVAADDCPDHFLCNIDGPLMEEPPRILNPAFLGLLCRPAVEAGCRAVLGGHWGDMIIDGDAYFSPQVMAEVPMRAWPQELGPFARRTGRHPLRVGGHMLIRRMRSVMRKTTNHFADHLSHQLQSGGTAAKLSEFERLGRLFGVEWRLPFLDRRLIEFVMACPWKIRFFQGETRRLVRRGVNLPAAIRDRRTKAFQTEMALSGLVRKEPMIRRLAGSTRAVQEGLCAQEESERTCGRFFAQPSFSSWMPLSRLVALEMWFRSSYAR
jgi:asparagine synthase (glutamine-hydrolysing)